MRVRVNVKRLMLMLATLVALALLPWVAVG